MAGVNYLVNFDEFFKNIKNIDEKAFLDSQDLKVCNLLEIVSAEEVFSNEFVDNISYEMLDIVEHILNHEYGSDLLLYSLCYSERFKEFTNSIRLKKPTQRDLF